MKTTFKRYLLRRIAQTLAPAGMLLAPCLPSVHAESIHWVNPDGGFYENADAWVPAQVPTGPTAQAVFGQQVELPIGLLQDHSVGELLFANQTDVRLNTAGPVPDGSPGPNRILSATQATIDNASVRLQNTNSVESSDVFLHVSDTLNVDGRLNVDHGARVNAHLLNLGTQPGQTSVATFAGADSTNGPTRVDSRVITVGNGTKADLVIQDGGYLKSHIGYVGRNAAPTPELTSRVLVHGTHNGTPSSWDASAIVVGFNGAGRLSAIGGASINTDSLAIGTGLTNEPEDIGVGQAEVVGHDGQGRSSTLNVDLLGIGVRGSGNFSVIDGAELNSGRTYIAQTQGAQGNMYLHATDDDPISNWTNSGNVAVGGDMIENGGTGRLEIRSRSHAEIDGELKVWPGSTVEVDGGTLAARQVQVDPGANFLVTDGTWQIDAYEGAELLQRGGRIAPGPGTGRTNISANFTQRGGATTSLDIGGTVGGETHDRIAVEGNALVDGTLDVDIVDGFVPRQSDSFNVVSAEVLFGVYQNASNGERLATRDGFGSFMVNYGLQSSFDQNSVVLSAFMPTLAGDFDIDGQLTANDIDILSDALHRNDLEYDLTKDGVVDGDDRNRWVHDLASTYYGDSNLDGEFNSGDFVHVFKLNRYEDEIANNAGWNEGDWNGDGEFDSSDFVFAFRANGYEVGPRAAAASAVPEPSSSMLMLPAVAAFGFVRRRWM